MNLQGKFKVLKLSRLPLVSVIIPNFNHAEFLQQRIETVLNQTFKSFEVIVLDDCSSDGSQSIISRFTPHPLITHVVFNEVNSGSPFKQWKKGIDLAQGNWVWIAESDDFADERFLEEMIRQTNGPNIGLVYCDSRIINKDSVTGETIGSIKNKRMNTTRWNHDHFNEGQSEIEEYLLPNGTINNSSAVLFRKDVLVDSNPFDLDLKYTGDKYAFIKVLARSDVAYVGEPLNYFRNPFNKKSTDKFLIYFYEQFLIYDWVQKNLKVRNKVKFFEGFHANTRNSLFRDWGAEKLSIYLKLFRQNPMLLINSISHNFWQGMRSMVYPRRISRNQNGDANS